MSNKFTSYDEFTQFVGPEPRCVLAAGGGYETPEDSLVALVSASDDVDSRLDKVKTKFAATPAQDERQRPVVR